MLSKIVEQIAFDPLTFWFVCVCGAWFVIALMLQFQTRGEHRFSRSAPGALVSIGVLGTFMGIFVGLADFNVNEIDSSVPRLLEGMKVAFITSLVGMGLSIIFKLAQNFTPVRQQISSDEVTGTDLLNALNSIRVENRELGTTIGNGLERIKTVISGDGDASITTQLQKMRLAVVDRIDDLSKENREALSKVSNELRTFGERVAELGSNALIEALKEVISDFNAKLTTQFGENFAHLNQAVEKLVSWQDKYREHVETLVDQFRVAQEGVEHSRLAVAGIAESVSSLPQAARGVSDLLTSIQHQIDSLEQHLVAFADLKKSAADAMPIIEASLLKIGSSMQSSAEKNAQTISQSVEIMERAFADQSGALSKLTGEVARSVREASDSVVAAQKAHEDLARDLNESFAEFTEKARMGTEKVLDEIDRAGKLLVDRIVADSEKSNSEIRKVASDSSQKLANLIEESGKMLSGQLIETDKQMGEQLTEAINKMGSKLASLSGKFVTDYAELASLLERLAKIGSDVGGVRNDR